MSPPGLRVIALISGGKDSLFSILHCLQNGHEIVALANLYPQKQAEESEKSNNNKNDDDDTHKTTTIQEERDLDSYMYQTIGHSIIQHYADALGIPLYRRAISGTAQNTSLDYPSATAPASSFSSSDEVESLLFLLQEVMAATAATTATATATTTKTTTSGSMGANAVCCGAILSTYQRTRVESVALRLGLVPLAPLWQFPCLPPRHWPTALLDDMRTVGQEARIVKVASGGLDGGFVWQDVGDAAVVKRLVARMRRFGCGDDDDDGDFADWARGGAVLGEGGEFETLTVSGPAPLWKRRIVVEKVDVDRVDDWTFVARLGKTTTEEMGETKVRNAGPRMPDLLDGEFEQLIRRLEDGKKDSSSSIQPYEGEISVEEVHKNFTVDTTWTIQKHGTTIRISNMNSTAATVSEQMEDIKQKLEKRLASLHLTPASITSTTLLLRHMEDFIDINKVYGSIFTESNPPSRVTVACGDLLPPKTQVLVSMVMDRIPRERRRGLHVQSRSYWAPANIGPYSQAIAIPIETKKIEDDDDDGDESTEKAELVHIAGQIPLVPTSMEIVRLSSEQADSGKDEFILQTSLSLQHLWRVGRTMEVNWWTGGIAFLSRCTAENVKVRAEAALNAWTQCHSIYVQQFEDEAENSRQDDEIDVWDLKNRVVPSSIAESELDCRWKLPNPSKVSMRGALSTECPPVYVVEMEQLPRGADIEWWSMGIAGSSRISQEMATVGVEGTNLRISWTGIRTPEEILQLEAKGLFQQNPEDAEEIPMPGMVYTTIPLPMEWLKRERLQIIPCRSIWGGQTQQYVALIMKINSCTPKREQF